MSKRSLSGIKPTGNIHVGNYFGAMKQFVDMQDEYENFIFIADYHALNQIQDPQILSRNILETAKAYLAIGIDPQKTVLFRQSDILSITDLCWIFNSITSMSVLKRAHAYKDALNKKTNINMGLFDYPVLMAADILLYDSDIVPVGKDQEQHVEIAREIAQNFNKIYGKTFKLPKSLISEDVSIIKGIDGRKMSKSYENVIGMFDETDVLRKKIMSIVTDSKDKDEPKDILTCSIYSLHKLFSQKNLKDIERKYVNGGISYKESKEILFENILQFLSPIQTKKREIDTNPDYVLQVLKSGSENANYVATLMMEKVRNSIGLNLQI